MSADVLQQLNQDGVLTVDQLADLFNLRPHSVYPYLDMREMRYSQVRTLCRRSRDQRIPAAFFNDLMASTGWCPLYIETELDFDGDGDVDTDDVLGHAIEALGDLSKFLKKVHAGDEPDLHELADLKQRVLQGVVTSARAAEHITARKTPRRKARTVGGVR